MEFTVTKEFIIEAHKAACSEWKERIEKEFPDLFETQLEVGKWYKTAGGCLFFLSHFEGEQNEGYGFNKKGLWVNSSSSFFGYKSDIASEATPKEVEAALIAEAKKRGFVEGVKFKTLDGSKRVCTFRGISSFFADIINAYVDKKEWRVKGEYISSNPAIFQDGKWATILPEEKTIITKGKALRIIAKKLKVSPESIEIQ